MEQFMLFFSSMLTAVAMENAIFTRGLGLGKYALFMETPKRGILYGVLTTWMLTVSSVFVALANYALNDHPLVMYLRAPSFFVCVGVVYAVTYFICRAAFKELFAVIVLALPLCTFNTAVFGALYITAMQGYSFLQVVGYALGTGIGYTMAVFIIYFARKRLALSPIPRSFKGLPILLIYIGILSLALYGLTGHGLAV